MTGKLYLHKQPAFPIFYLLPNGVPQTRPVPPDRPSQLPFLDYSTLLAVVNLGFLFITACGREERQPSAAAGSGSAADAGGNQLQGVVSGYHQRSAGRVFLMQNATVPCAQGIRADLATRPVA